MSASEGGSPATPNTGSELPLQSLLDELREMHARTALAEQIAGLGTWTWTVATGIVRWSDQLYGLSREADGDMSFERYVERVHEDDRERVAGLIGAAVAERASFRFEERIRRPDGEIRRLLSEGTVVTGPDGDVARVAGVCHDVTEQREAATALEQIWRLQRAVLESTSQGIFGLDLDGNANLVNAAAAQMLGWEAGELIGTRIHDVIHHTHADDRPFPSTEYPIYATLEDGGVQRRSDEVFWRRDGTSFPVEYTATPLHGGGGLEGAVVTFSDITQRRRSEDELMRYAQRLVSLRAPTPEPALDRAATRDTSDAAPPSPAQIVQRATALAREQLGMELAFVSELFEGNEVVRTIHGDLPSFGIGVGSAVPLPDTYCRRVLDGELPNVIPDTRADPRVADMAVTKQLRVGAYVSVPIELPGGRVYGMLCCLSHEAMPGLDERDARFLQSFAGIVADQLAREELEAEARRARGDATTARALILALEARDHYTGTHSESVVALAHAVGRELGMSETEIGMCEQVARLHDIGKVGVPDSVLQKPGPLDELDWQIMREHPEIGARIIAGVPALAHLAPAVRAEHERWDGTGYPDGLAGEAIPLASRITLCCDAFHAMTSDRPYRAAMTQAAALRELQANAGGQFDPAVVAALVSLVSIVSIVQAD